VTPEEVEAIDTARWDYYEYTPEQTVYERKMFDRKRRCIGCGVHCWLIDEFYMVRDELWLRAFGGFYAGMACIGCLEERIGRELARPDFIPSMLDIDLRDIRSERLRDRLSRDGDASVLLRCPQFPRSLTRETKVYMAKRRNCRLYDPGI
jgi:hypothetical protein